MYLCASVFSPGAYPYASIREVVDYVCLLCELSNVV